MPTRGLQQKQGAGIKAASISVSSNVELLSWFPASYPRTVPLNPVRNLKPVRHDECENPWEF